MLLNLKFSTLFGFLALLILSSCNSGEFSIDLDLSDKDNNLNPFNSGEIEYLNLIAYGKNKQVSFSHKYSNSSYINFGNIPVGEYSKMVMTGNTIDGVMVAYGSYSGKVAVDPTNKTSATIPFRYPLTYLTGSSSLFMFHPFLSNSGMFSPLVVGTQSEKTTAVGISPNGKILLVSTYNYATTTAEVLAISTKNHSKVFGRANVPLTGPIDKIIFSPEGEFATLMSNKDNYISFLNVSDFISVLDNTSAFKTVNFVKPNDAAFINKNTVMILSADPFYYGTCTNYGDSNLGYYTLPSDLSIHTELSVEKTINLDKYTSSIRADINSQRLFLANPCDSSVSVNYFGDITVSELLSKNNIAPCETPVQVLTDKKYLYLSCKTSKASIGTYAPAQLTVQRLNLSDLSGGTNPINLPYPAEAFLYDSGGQSGVSLELFLDPESVIPIQLGLAVDSNKIVLLAEAYYEVDKITVGGINIDGIKRKSRSLTIIDPISNSITKRFRSACYEVSDEDDSTIPSDFGLQHKCADMMGVESPEIEFVAHSISSVFGIQ